MTQLAYQFAAIDAAEQLLDKYDPQTQAFEVDRSSNLWRTVEKSNRRGMKGDGRSIAVIDSGFDTTFDALSNSRVVGDNPPVSDLSATAHGTAVALLVRSVAPDAELTLYPVSEGQTPNVGKIMRAFGWVRESNCDLVNFSIGHRIAGESILERLGESAHRCEVSDGLENLVKSGKHVFVSVGNSRHDAFCPAQRGNLFSAGFRREMRQLSDDGEEEVAFWGEPTYSQTIMPSLTFMQPDDVLGSSFASPLLTGLAALRDDPEALWPLSQSLQAEAHASEQLALLRSGALSETDEVLRGIHSLYAQSVDLLPHWHDEPDAFCPYCSTFSESVLVNAGLFLYCYSDSQHAEQLLRPALGLVPWSPHVAANLGRLLLSSAEERLAQGNVTETVLSLLEESKSLYEAATSRRPLYRGYDAALAEATAHIERLKSPA